MLNSLQVHYSGVKDAYLAYVAPRLCINLYGPSIESKMPGCFDYAEANFVFRA